MVEEPESGRSIDQASLAGNLAAVQDRITAAARRSGRAPDAVRLVAVTKTVDVATVRRLLELGIRDLGENRVQTALPKVDAIGSGPAWHFIGRIQSNKVRKIVPRFRWLHAIAGCDLIERIARVAEELACPRPRLLIQVNVTEEPAKQGLRPEEVAEVLRGASSLESVKVVGLMTMARYDPVAETSRPAFARLRSLRDEANRHGWYRAPLEELSMGMSNDYVVAVEEGSTLVRVGSALYDSIGGGDAANPQV